MIIEHWREDNCETAIVKGSNGYFFDATPTKCCEIEGTDWNDCMRKYYEHMGWEPYKPDQPIP